MKLFDLIFVSIIILLLIIYFTLCSNTIVKPFRHLHKFKIEKINENNSEDKLKNLLINSIGLILTLFIIAYEYNYIQNTYNSNIYVRLIQVIIVLCILFMIHIPDEYKPTFVKSNNISNSFKPLIMGASVMFTSSINDVYLLI